VRRDRRDLRVRTQYGPLAPRPWPSASRPVARRRSRGAVGVIRFESEHEIVNSNLMNSDLPELDRRLATLRDACSGDIPPPASRAGPPTGARLPGGGRPRAPPRTRVAAARRTLDCIPPGPRGVDRHDRVRRALADARYATEHPRPRPGAGLRARRVHPARAG